MSVIDRLDRKELWLSFMEERMATGNMDKRRAEDLQAFIQDEGYLDVVGKIRRGENFLPPLKKSEEEGGILVFEGRKLCAQAAYLSPGETV